MKPDLHVKLVNDWDLQPDYQKDLDGYYLLHWSVLHLFKKLTEAKDGLISHNGKLFVPVLKSESFPLDSSAQAMLSFRIVDGNSPEFWGIPNYVLIKAM